MKKLYFACNFDCTGRPGFPPTSCLCAYTIECTDADNLVELFDRFRNMGIKTANLMPSRKAANELCKAWNDSYRANGTCAF